MSSAPAVVYLATAKSLSDPALVWPTTTILPSVSMTRSWALSLLPPKSVIIIPSPPPKVESIVPLVLSRATPKSLLSL